MRETQGRCDVQRRPQGSRALVEWGGPGPQAPAPCSFREPQVSLRGRASQASLRLACVSVMLAHPQVYIKHLLSVKQDHEKERKADGGGSSHGSRGGLLGSVWGLPNTV